MMKTTSRETNPDQYFKNHYQWTDPLEQVATNLNQDHNKISNLQLKVILAAENLPTFKFKTKMRRKFKSNKVPNCQWTELFF